MRHYILYTDTKAFNDRKRKIYIVQKKMAYGINTIYQTTILSVKLIMSTILNEYDNLF